MAPLYSGSWQYLNWGVATGDWTTLESTAYGNYTTTITYSSPMNAAQEVEDDEPDADSALAWLDRRVDEMRVKL